MGLMVHSSSIEDNELERVNGFRLKIIQQEGLLFVQDGTHHTNRKHHICQRRTESGAKYKLRTTHPLKDLSLKVVCGS